MIRMHGCGRSPRSRRVREWQGHFLTNPLSIRFNLSHREMRDRSRHTCIWNRLRFSVYNAVPKALTSKLVRATVGRLSRRLRVRRSPAGSRRQSACTAPVIPVLGVNTRTQYLACPRYGEQPHQDEVPLPTRAGIQTAVSFSSDDTYLMSALYSPPGLIMIIH